MCPSEIQLRQQEQRAGDAALCGRIKHSKKVQALLLAGNQKGVIGVGLIATGTQHGAHQTGFEGEPHSW